MTRNENGVFSARSFFKSCASRYESTPLCSVLDASDVHASQCCPCGEDKVLAMIASNVAAMCPDGAFPQALVRYEDGRFAGFLMEQVLNHQPIHELIGSASRRRYFPGADWRLLVRVGINIARTVASVHRAGIVLGDINSSGFLVSQRGEVKLIDTDSFQIGRHRCRVGMPEYTPPELQGVHLSEVDRTMAHDRFGLAVLLFQILMLGRHPFAGVPRGRPIPLQKAIQEERFAFTRMADLGVRPPPHSLLLSDLPRAISHAFERAFLSAGGGRPSAADWVSVLSDLEMRLIPCLVRQDHAMVPISTACPWCRIERETGRPLFNPNAGRTAEGVSASVDGFRTKAKEAIYVAKRHAGESIEPPWHRPVVKPSKEARDVVAAADERAAIKLAQRRHDVLRQAERALKQWREGIGVWEVHRLSEELRSVVTDLERFYARQSLLLNVSVAQCFQKKVLEGLARKPLKAAGVVGIGDAMVAKLAGHGIVTAADVVRDRLLAVSGIGSRRIVNLLFWRDALAVAVEKDVARSATALAAAKVEAIKRVASRRDSLEQIAKNRLIGLQEAVSRVCANATYPDPNLAAVLLQRDRAKSDLAMLHTAFPALSHARSVPSSSVSSKPARRAASKKAHKAKAGKVCPRCGLPMVKRWGGAASGKKSSYYGCSAYPACKGSSP